MSEQHPFEAVDSMYVEFGEVHSDLVRHLVALREEPSTVLRQRVRAITENPSRHVGRGRFHFRIMRTIGASTAVLLVAMLVIVLSPQLRVAAAQTIADIRRSLLQNGMRITPDGRATFVPTPRFVVYQPNQLPDGFRLAGQRYAETGRPVVYGLGARPIDSPPFDPVIQAVVQRNRGADSHLVLVYAVPVEQYVALFERAAKEGEALPVGPRRVVHNQPATLRQNGNVLTVTWIDAGTWIEAEGTLPESDMLAFAASLVPTQHPLPEDGDAASADLPSLSPPVPCDPAKHPSEGPLLGGKPSDAGLRGSIRVELLNRPAGLESVSYGANIQDTRAGLFAPALEAMHNPATPMQRLPYQSVSSFVSEDKGGCLRANPDVEGYVVIEVWADHVRVGYGGSAIEHKGRVIKALEQELRALR